MINSRPMSFFHHIRQTANPFLKINPFWQKSNIES
jgi:hypothetical protein